MIKWLMLILFLCPFAFGEFVDMKDPRFKLPENQLPVFTDSKDPRNILQKYDQNFSPKIQDYLDPRVRQFDFLTSDFNQTTDFNVLDLNLSLIGSPAGDKNQIQFNDAGNFAGDINFYYDKVNDLLYARRIGVAFDLNTGTFPHQALDVAGNIDITPVQEPLMDSATLTIDYNTSYDLNIGDYGYSLGYQTVDGNTEAGNGNLSNCQTVTLTGKARVIITNIPIPTDKRVTKKIIFRSNVNDYATSCVRNHAVAFLNPNVTSYTDNIPDSLTDQTTSGYRRDNTTAAGIYFNNAKATKFGRYNTGIGLNALLALKSNATQNVAVGQNAFSALSTGTSNTAIGHDTCTNLTTGSENVCIGTMNSISNAGSNNVSVGYLTGYGVSGNVTFSNNTIVGSYALGGATASNVQQNVVIGSTAGQNDANSIGNILIGYYAGRNTSSTTIGGRNTIIGTSAAYTMRGVNYSTIIGHQANYAIRDGNYQIVIGANVKTKDDNRNGSLSIGNVLFGTGMHSTTTISSNPTTDGKIGIKNPDPIEEFDVNGQSVFRSDTNTYGVIYGNATPISIWADGNISAAGYITRTETYDKTFGKALAQIRDADEYKLPSGKADDTKYGYSTATYKRKIQTGTWKKKETVVECETIEIIQDKEDPTKETKVEECKEKDIYIETPIYSTIEEKGVNLEKEIALLKQAIYEIKYCIKTTKTHEETKRCIGN